jgi:hypothetical protein
VASRKRVRPWLQPLVRLAEERRHIGAHMAWKEPVEFRKAT